MFILAMPFRYQYEHVHAHTNEAQQIPAQQQPLAQSHHQVHNTFESRQGLWDNLAFPQRTKKLEALIAYYVSHFAKKGLSKLIRLRKPTTFSTEIKWIGYEFFPFALNI